MKTLNSKTGLFSIVTILLFALYLQNGFAQIVVSGNISGTWTTGNSYWIAGDVTVPENNTLVIEPGVDVFFTGTWDFTVNGLLQANGTAENKIIFRGNGSPGTWKKIHFSDKIKKGCILNHCIIQDGGWGDQGSIFIFNNDTSVTISNSEIQKSASHAIYIQSYIFTGGSDYITKRCSPFILKNIIHNNAGNGIYVYAYHQNTTLWTEHSTSQCLSIIKNNTIHSNHQNGIICYSYAKGPSERNLTVQANPIIQQNTVFSNFRNGIYCSKEQQGSISGIFEANPFISSNIISNNGEFGLNANNTVSINKVKHNDFWKNISSNFSGIGGGLGIIGRTNMNGDSCDVNLNIFFDPEFVDEGNQDFHLISTSKCINAGDLILPWDPDGSFPDIGAYSAYVLKASFISDVTAGSLPMTVHFTSTSTHAANPITSYQWDFGDGGTSTTQNPTHTYLNAGNYDVSLNVSDGSAPDTTTKKNYITVFSGPQMAMVGIDTLNAFPNDTILVPINIAFPTDSSASSAEISIGSYFGKLKFIEIVTTGSLTGNANWLYQLNETDSLNIIWSAGSAYISGSGVFFYLKFWVPDTASGFIPITLKSVVFDTGAMPVIITSGGVNIKTTLPLYGDVDLNGKIQAYDASLILKYLVGIVNLNEEQLINANVTLDTTISALDATLILQYGVGIIDTLPYNTTMGNLAAIGDITIDDQNIQAAPIIEVPLKLSNGNNILSFEGKIIFDPTILTFNSIEWSELNDKFMIELRIENGIIKFAGADSLPDGKTGVFATLKFNLGEKFNQGATIITIEKWRWNEEPVMDNVASATIVITSIVENRDKLPDKFTLYENYPNPFNPETTIQYQLPRSVPVKLAIFDLLGQQIRVLVDERQPAGYYTTRWTGQNEMGQQVASGIYFYRLQAGEFVAVRKLTLLR